MVTITTLPCDGYILQNSCWFGLPAPWLPPGPPAVYTDAGVLIPPFWTGYRGSGLPVCTGLNSYCGRLVLHMPHDSTGWFYVDAPDAGLWTRADRYG